MRRKENAEVWARNITSLTPWLTDHPIFILKIFKKNIAYFSLVENSMTHRYMLILLTLALIKQEKNMPYPPSGYLRSGRFRGSSHARLIFFLTFNYSPSLVSISCLSFPLPLLCQGQRGAPYHPPIWFMTWLPEISLPPDFCLPGPFFTWCQEFILRRRKKKGRKSCIPTFPSPLKHLVLPVL